MKTVRYSIDALKSLKRHGNVASRVRKAIEANAIGEGAHSNQVTRLAGSTASRLRVGDFRAIFEESLDVVLEPRYGFLPVDEIVALSDDE